MCYLWCLSVRICGWEYEPPYTASPAIFRAYYQICGTVGQSKTCRYVPGSRPTYQSLIWLSAKRRGAWGYCYVIVVPG